MFITVITYVKGVKITLFNFKITLLSFFVCLGCKIHNFNLFLKLLGVCSYVGLVPFLYLLIYILSLSLSLSLFLSFSLSLSLSLYSTHLSIPPYYGNELSLSPPPSISQLIPAEGKRGKEGDIAWGKLLRGYKNPGNSERTRIDR